MKNNGSVTRWAILVCAAAGIACGGGGSSDNGEPGGSTCDTSGGRITVGEYYVDNNTSMNRDAKHPVDNFTQCAGIHEGSTAGTVQATWSWSWPIQADPTERVTRATPGITFGHGPWDSGSTSSALPRGVGEFESLTIDANVTQTLSADEEMMFGVVAYLTTSTQKVGDSLPIARRLLVYRNLYPKEQRNPIAQQILIGGIQWDLEVNPPYYVMYYPHSEMDVPATELHLDLADFLEDALNRGEISPSWWLTSVSTALIITQGDGELKLDNYRVEVQRKAH